MRNKKKEARCKTCQKIFFFYSTAQKGIFCSKKCQYSYNYPGCFWKGKKGRKYKELVHRLIAGVSDKKIVHHKDGNKLNNNLDNLEILSSQSEHIKKHNPIFFRWKL